MSKHINVNPGQYKVGGREHPGDDILHEVEKQQYAQAQKNIEENASIPNQKNESAAARGDENRAGNATASSNSSSSDY